MARDKDKRKPEKPRHEKPRKSMDKHHEEQKQDRREGKWK